MFQKIEYDFKNSDFKREWNNIELEGVLAILKREFKEEYSIQDTEDKFGLVYTSTSTYAMLSNTNCNFEIEEGWNLKHFAITNNDLLIAVAWDENENEKFYRVEF